MIKTIMEQTINNKIIFPQTCQNIVCIYVKDIDPHGTLDYLDYNLRFNLYLNLFVY